MRVPILVAAGAALALLGQAPLAGAQDLLTYDVAWQREAGAESCPDRAAFVAAVEARVIANRLEAGSSRKLDVRLSREPDKWHAELRVIERGVVKGSQELEFAGAACSGLFNALVAIAAVTLGEAPPESARAEKIEPAETKPEPEPPPTPPADPSSWPTIYEPLSAPEEETERRRPRPWTRSTLTLEIAQDYLYKSAETNVCGPCLDNGEPANIEPAPGDNRVSSGLLVGNKRILAGLLLNVSEWAVIELRLGGAVTSYSASSVMFHGDVAFRYWLADRNAAVRTYVSTGLGGTEFNASFPVTVSDCWYLDRALVEACRIGNAPGTRRELVAVERLYFLFASARIGAAWHFADTQFLSLGLTAYITFPDEPGFVFEPTLGYGVEL